MAERPRLDKVIIGIGDHDFRIPASDVLRQSADLSSESNPDWDRIRETINTGQERLEKAEELVTLLPVINAILDNVGAGDVPDSVIEEMHQQLLDQQPIVGDKGEIKQALYDLAEPVQEEEERSDEVISQVLSNLPTREFMSGQPDTEGTARQELVETYPILQGLFENPENWVHDDDEGNFLKRTALVDYLAHKEKANVDTSSKKFALKEFFNGWNRKRERDGVNPVDRRFGKGYILTENEMVDFLLFMSDPPKERGIPKSYKLNVKEQISDSDVISEEELYVLVNDIITAAGKDAPIKPADVEFVQELLDDSELYGDAVDVDQERASLKVKLQRYMGFHPESKTTFFDKQTEQGRVLLAIAIGTWDSPEQLDELFGG